MNPNHPDRNYVRHRWVAHGKDGKHATCMVCGIGEKAWENKLVNASMMEWDCQSVQEKNKTKSKH